MCSKCGENPRTKGNSWCKQCNNEHAAAWRAEKRRRPQTQDRVCLRNGCDNRFTWSSMHAKQKYCSPACWDKVNRRRSSEKVIKRKVPPEWLVAKTCGRCHKFLLAAEYHLNRGAPFGVQGSCKRCCRIEFIMRHYSATEAEAVRLMITPVCENPRCTNTTDLHIDHDHQTGKFRGVLCRGCNQGLGQVADDADRLLGLAEYLVLT